METGMILNGVLGGGKTIEITKKNHMQQSKKDC